MYVEMGGNVVPVSKTGEQLRLLFRSFHDNRLSFIVRLRDPLVTEEAVGRLVLMHEPKTTATVTGDGTTPPACTLNFTLPDIVTVCGDETVTSDSRSEDDRTSDELKPSRLTDISTTGLHPHSCYHHCLIQHCYLQEYMVLQFVRGWTVFVKFDTEDRSQILRCCEGG